MGQIRMKRDRRFQCESLEDRNLLSAIPAATAELQLVKTKPVKETVTGTMDGTYRISGDLVTIQASGNLTVMGASTLSGQYDTAVNLKTFKARDTGGTAVLSNSQGDSLTSKFTGAGKVSNGAAVSSFKGKITGGTLEFNGATGKFASTSTASGDLFGTFQANVKLTVKVPAS